MYTLYFEISKILIFYPKLRTFKDDRSFQKYRKDNTVNNFVF
jgi:hypothetical protein